MIYRPRFSTELKVIDIFRICGMYWCALFHYLASRYGGVFTTGLNLDSDLGGGGVNMRVTGFLHVGVTVNDMEQSQDFYQKGLGLEFHHEVLRDREWIRELVNLPFESLHIVHLSIPGGGMVELLKYNGMERFSAASRPCDWASAHLALYVEDIDAIYERVQLHGGKARSEQPIVIGDGPTQGTRVLYVIDPNGFIVELIEKGPDN